MFKLLAFKWLIKELFLETEWWEVMLNLWFVSTKFTRSFSKFSFFNNLYKLFPLYFQLHWKNCPFTIYRYQYGSPIFFLCFFPQKGILVFFSFPHFSNKIVKPKFKTPFSKLLECYICYISNIRHLKLRGL